MKIPEILQVETPHAPGSLASVLNVNTVRRDQDQTPREITVGMAASEHETLVNLLNALPTARFVGWSDRTFARHREWSTPSSILLLTLLLPEFHYV